MSDDIMEKAGAFLDGYKKAQADGSEINFSQFSLTYRLRIAWYVICGRSLTFKMNQQENSDG